MTRILYIFLKKQEFYIDEKKSTLRDKAGLSFITELHAERLPIRY